MAGHEDDPPTTPDLEGAAGTKPSANWPAVRDSWIEVPAEVAAQAAQATAAAQAAQERAARG